MALRGFFILVSLFYSFFGLSQFTEKQVGNSISQLTDIFFVSPSVGYFGGVDGIFKTTNGGQTWTLLPYFVSTYQNFDSIYFTTMADHHLHFLNEHVGYSVGWGGMGNFEQIIKTTDGGATWQMQHQVNPDVAPFQPAELRLKDLHVVDAGTAISVGFRGRVLKTNNGGTNWIAKNSTTSKNLYAVSFLNESNGIIGGDQVILFTADGGETWTQRTTTHFFRDIRYLTAQELIGITDTKILKSYDGGNTWTQVPLPITGTFTKLSFLDDKNGFVSGNNVLFRTTDGGLSFEKYTFANALINSVHALSLSSLYMATTQGKAIYPDGTPIAYSPIAYYQADNLSPCVNQTISAVNLSPAGYMYEWFVDNVKVSSAYNLNYAFPIGGNRSLKLTVSNGAKTDSYTTNIAVRDLPALPAYDLRSNAASICLGDPVNLYVSNLNTAEVFDLYQGNTVIGTVGQIGKEFYFNSTSKLHIKLSATNSCGTRLGADSLKITVVPKPSPALQPKADRTSVCTGNATFIEIPGSEVGMIYTLTEDHAHDFDIFYEISAPGNGGTLKLPTPALTKPLKFNLTAKNSLGCLRYYGSYYITIRNFTVDFSVGPKFPALNAPLSITNTSTADSYEWTFSTGASPATSTALNPSPFFSNGGEKTIRLKAIVNEGCFKTLEKKVTVMAAAASTTLTKIQSQTLLDSTYRIKDYKVVNGNHYISGYTTTDNFTDWNGYTYKFFVAKFDATGTLQWLRKRLDTETDAAGRGSSAESLWIDSQDNVYVGGYFRGNQIQVGDSTYTSKRLDKPTETKGFLIKFGKTGNIKWTTLFEAAQVITVQSPPVSYSNTSPRSVRMYQDNLYLEMLSGPQPVSIRSAKTITLTSRSQYDEMVVKLDTAGRYQETLRFGFGGRTAVSFIDGDKFNTISSSFIVGGVAYPSMGMLDLRGTNGYYPMQYFNLFEIYGYTPLISAHNVKLSEPDSNTQYYSSAFRFIDHSKKELLVVSGDSIPVTEGGVVAAHNVFKQLEWIRYMPYAEVVDSEVIGTDLYILGNYRGAVGSILPAGGYAGIKAPTTDRSIFLAKYDAWGALQWINTIDGGTGNDVAYGIEKIPCSNDLLILATRASGLFLTTYSLDQDYPVEACLQAGFSSSFSDIQEGETIQFNDLSTGNPNEWLWTFSGAEMTSSSLAEPPAIRYMHAGEYKVSLAVSKPGKTSTRTIERYVSVHKPLAAKFAASKKVILVGDKVDFTDLSEGDPLSWNWQFDGAGLGFGMSSGDRHPQQVSFPVAGTYRVRLSISRYGRSSMKEEFGFITVEPLLKPNFNASQTEVLTTQSVVFTNLTEGSGAQYEWSFPGATPSTSSDVSPTVSYSVPGAYPVTLRAYTSIQSQVKTVQGYIQVTQKLTSNFSASKTNIVSGESINFTSLSIGGPQQYEWTFMGGTPAVSTVQNPSGIQYSASGTYPVTLKVTNSSQTDTKTVEGYITVLDQLVANFSASTIKVVEGESVTFSDASLGNPTSWLWSFEGGSIVSFNGKCPGAITYNVPGTYDVSLSVTRNAENKIRTVTDMITVYPLLMANFAPDKTEIFQDESIQFENLSTGGAETYLWTFQGGVPATSTAADPGLIMYPDPGVFDVTLKVTGNIQTKEITMSGLIVVNAVTGIHGVEPYSIFPNPSNGIFYVKGLKSTDVIEVVNSVGCKVDSWKMEEDGIQLQTAPGVYLLKISGDYVRVIKLIIR